MTNHASRHAYVMLFMLFSLLATPQTQAADEVVRIGFNVKITRDLNRADVQSALSLWADELSSKFNVPTESLFYDDMAVLRQEFDLGKVNFVIAAGMDFARYFKQSELAEGFRGAIQTDHTRKHSLQRIPNMHQDARGRQVLEIFKLDRLELVGTDELRPFYELLSDYEALRPASASKWSAR